jgi:CRISPR-associated endonuclease/helicase Cas3
MLSLILQSQHEYRWSGENPAPLSFPHGLLYHQWRTYQASAPIIVNTHNTGTGKTKAALLRLLKRAQEKGFANLFSEEDSVIFIAPTNELIAQHARDARDFCIENQLPYRVLPITAKKIDEYKDQTGFSEGPLRRAAALHYILRDGSLVKGDYDKQATIYVVNPDIFYYATYFLYQPNYRDLLFDHFLKFNYIIIDELHYYDPKQLAAFLFFIKLSQHYGYIGSSAKGQACILTATPRPQVADYLTRTGLPIDWITPGEEHIPAEGSALIEPVPALTPVHLSVYSTEELRENEGLGGLAQLVRRERATVRDWLYKDDYDGAIISSSLGRISTIHQVLRGFVQEQDMGRITGAQDQPSRSQAREKRLILATPTVDIGYNFERSQNPKPRQNIDFLLIDASASDELVQRVGRAGRVLGKQQQDIPSEVRAVIDPESYKLLRSYDGQTISRETFSKLARQMPRKNDLYAYIRGGAIIEAFHTISRLQTGLSDAEQHVLNTFFQELQTLFAGQDQGTGKLLTYKYLAHYLRQFSQRQQHYGALQAIPPETFEHIALAVQGPITWKPSKVEQALLDRLRQAIKSGEVTSKKKATQWLRHDIADYFKDRARFSFRDSFQPPPAVVYDPGRLHSDTPINSYDALHFIKYYEARWFDTLNEWREAIRSNGDPQWQAEVDPDAAAYCYLTALRESPIRIGLELDARDYSRADWEEQHAYQVTALYGLRIVALGDDRGLSRNVYKLFSQQFIPAFVAWNDPQCFTWREMRKLEKTARFYPIQLTVSFDRDEVRYSAVPGNMAFQLCAELPYWALQKDLRRTFKEDDQPLIC